MQSAIYQGNLRHRRFFPKRHEFNYSSTLFYIDLDELPGLFSGIKGWSLNTANLGCFRRKDYLGDPAVPLADAVRNEVKRLLAEQNQSQKMCPDGPIRMLTNLRIWGFCFNPVTLYYLFFKDAHLPAMILAQVNNTPWNERHSYLVHCDPHTGKSNTQFDKAFHVSPFNPLDMYYHWVSSLPAENLLVHMENHAVGADSNSVQCHMDATLTLKRQPWSARLLRQILLRQPWLAIKVPVAIYWQALRLFFKGVPVYTHPSINAHQSIDLRESYDAFPLAKSSSISNNPLHTARSDDRKMTGEQP